MLVARGPASADIVMVLAMTKTRRVGNAQLATILEGVRCAEGKEKPNRSTTWQKCSPISIPPLLCHLQCLVQHALELLPRTVPSAVASSRENNSSNLLKIASLVRKENIIATLQTYSSHTLSCFLPAPRLLPSLLKQQAGI